jgi:GNAT superfamily N-acetyltransferase
MEIIKYNNNYLEEVFTIVHDTIEKIYPKYYPRGAVDFFHCHHSIENMKKQMPNESTLLLWDNKIVGTGTLSGNEIKRFFVLPEYQGKGYGKLLLKELEKNIDGNKYNNFILDSSLGAVEFYKNNGYVYKEYKKIDLSDGNYLCYLEMVKNINYNYNELNIILANANDIT